MFRTMTLLWSDQRGFVCSTEVILLGTILLIGTIVGLVALRNQVVQEFGDVGTALAFREETPAALTPLGVEVLPAPETLGRTDAVLVGDDGDAAGAGTPQTAQGVVAPGGQRLFDQLQIEPGDGGYAIGHLVGRPAAVGVHPQAFVGGEPPDGERRESSK